MALTFLSLRLEEDPNTGRWRPFVRYQGSQSNARSTDSHFIRYRQVGTSRFTEVPNPIGSTLATQLTRDSDGPQEFRAGNITISLLPNTEYEITYQYISQSSGTLPSIASTTFGSPPTSNLGALSIATSATSLSATVQIRTRYNGTVYWRLTRGFEEISTFQDSVTTSTAQVNRTFGRLFPNREYTVTVSQFANYTNPRESTLFTSQIEGVEGVEDTSLTMSQTVSFWRSVFDLEDLTIDTGPDFPVGLIPPDQGEVTSRGLLKALATRCIGGLFERNDGSLRIISRNRWLDQADLGLYSFKDFRFRRFTLRSDEENRLAITQVSYQQFVAATGDNFNTEIQTREINNINAVAEERYGRNEVRIPYFVLWQSNQLPQTLEPILQLIGGGAPLILSVDVLAELDANILSARLRALEPGRLATFEVMHDRGTIQHKGLIINKEWRESQGRADPYWRVQVWVLETNVIGSVVARYNESMYNDGEVYG